MFGDVINPPSLGFVEGFVVEVITGGCGPGKRGKMTCQADKKWSKAFNCSGNEEISNAIYLKMQYDNNLIFSLVIVMIIFSLVLVLRRYGMYLVFIIL